MRIIVTEVNAIPLVDHWVKKIVEYKKKIKTIWAKDKSQTIEMHAMMAIREAEEIEDIMNS